MLSLLNGTKRGRVAAIFEMAAILLFFSVGTISNIVQYINIYQYATFDAVWSDISMISLLNVTKPRPVAAIFEMAAILDFSHLALYPILFSISISIIVPNFMLVTKSAQFHSYFHHFLPL